MTTSSNNGEARTLTVEEGLLATPALTTAKPGAGAAPTPERVALPSIRAARSWDAATDALLAALDLEEAQALVVFEAARERVKAARRAAGAIRQLRGVVAIGEPTTATTRGTGRPSVGGRWSRAHDACTNCSTTTIKHGSHGLCTSCATYFGRHGVERPVSQPQEQTA